MNFQKSLKYTSIFVAVFGFVMVLSVTKAFAAQISISANVQGYRWEVFGPNGFYYASQNDVPPTGVPGGDYRINLISAPNGYSFSSLSGSSNPAHAGNISWYGTFTQNPAPPPPPPPPPVPTASLWADSYSLPSGGSTIIHWSSSNATSCTAYGAINASVGPSGDYNTGPLSSGTYTEYLYCSGAGGNSPTQSINITVSAPPPPPPAPAPVCASTHYNCSSGTAINGSETSSAWTWLCRNADNVDASCSEAKPPPPAPAPVCASTHYNCSSGTAINGSETSTAYSWLCRNADNVDASCSETKPKGTIQITNNKTSFSYCVFKDGSQIFCDTRSMSFPGYDANHSYSVTPSNQTGYTVAVSPSGGQTLSGGGTVPFTITYTKKSATASITCPSGVVPYGGSTNINWSSTNSNSCTVSPTGWTGTSGSQSDGPLYANKTYSITCNP